MKKFFNKKNQKKLKRPGIEPGSSRRKANGLPKPDLPKTVSDLPKPDLRPLKPNPKIHKSRKLLMLFKKNCRYKIFLHLQYVQEIIVKIVRCNDARYDAFSEKFCLRRCKFNTNRPQNWSKMYLRPQGLDFFLFSPFFTFHC